MSIVCLDIETTGFSREKDEVLQLSIIDGDYGVLFDEYLKPRVKESWYYAQKVHNISPQMVVNKFDLLYYKDYIESLINSADIIVGYNLKAFDIPFLLKQGIDIDGRIQVFDVMCEYRKVTKGVSKFKLTDCAEFYNYQFNAHNSLEDVKATLHCYYAMRVGGGVR